MHESWTLAKLPATHGQLAESWRDADLQVIIGVGKGIGDLPLVEKVVASQ
jgi:hypothetical protein